MAKLWYVAPMALSRRNLLALFAVDVVLFVLANVFYHDGHTLNDVSNVVWVAFVVGVVLLIALTGVALVQSRRRTR